MRPLRVSIIGISVDLGLLAKTQCHPQHSLKLWLFLMRLVPTILIWIVCMLALRSAFFLTAKDRRQKLRMISHKLFGFMLSKENFHEHETGFLARLEDFFQRSTEVTNLSRIGHSVRLAHKEKHLIPSGQDIVFLDLGAMDFVNNTSCAEFRALLRDLLATVGSRNPQAHVVFFSPPDMVTMLGTDMNRRKALPLPFAPKVEDLQRLEGFHKLGVKASSTLEKKAKASKILRVYLSIMQHELRRAKRLAVIRSFTFINGLELPIYRPEDRSLYFGLDGLHMTSQAISLLVELSWPALARDLGTMTHLLPGGYEQEMVRKSKPQPSPLLAAESVH